MLVTGIEQERFFNFASLWRGTRFPYQHDPIGLAQTTLSPFRRPGIGLIENKPMRGFLVV